MDAPDVLRHNTVAWDKECDNAGEWSRPVNAEVIANARRGDWQVILTPNKAVPREWFGDVKGRDVLCLASGGGQQGPILSAAGATQVHSPQRPQATWFAVLASAFESVVSLSAAISTQCG